MLYFFATYLSKRLISAERPSVMRGLMKAKLATSRLRVKVPSMFLKINK